MVPSLDLAADLTAPKDDWTTDIVRVKRMPFILPALRTRPDDGGSAAVSELAAAHLKRLLDLEQKPITKQKGLEASIAQGFKADAQLHRQAGLDDDALTQLGRAEFWYSQINLLQAITVRAAYAGQLPQAKQHPSELLV